MYVQNRACAAHSSLVSEVTTKHGLLAVNVLDFGRYAPLAIPAALLGLLVR